MNSKRKFSVLLIGPPRGRMGGVTDYLSMLMSNLNHNFEICYLSFGRKNPADSPTLAIIGFVNDMIALFRVITKKYFDIIQLNPSFKINSLVRDSIYLLLISMAHQGRKTVVFFHGWDEFLAERIKRSAFLTKLIRSIYKKVSTIVVLYDTCREQLINLGVDPAKIRVETTMYASYRNSKEGEGPIKEKIDKKKTILFMSRFVRAKGLFIAADVARFLVQNRPNEFRFIFAGGGPEFEGLKKHVSEQGLEDYIDVPGFVSGEAKKKILAKSDIFLFPTYFGEGCPVVILEAMGAGLAIVSTPVGAIPDIVTHNENGFIINSKDPKEFYEAIIKLVDDERLLRKIQKMNIEKAEKNYEAKVATRRIEKLYMSVIQA